MKIWISFILMWTIGFVNLIFYVKKTSNFSSTMTAWWEYWPFFKRDLITAYMLWCVIKSHSEFPTILHTMKIVFSCKFSAINSQNFKGLKLGKRAHKFLIVFLTACICSFSLTILLSFCAFYTCNDINFLLFLHWYHLRHSFFLPDLQ